MNLNKFLNDNLIYQIISFSKKINIDIYFVGGCVRDTILGIKSHDIDIVPFGIDYREFSKILKKKLNASAVPFKDNVRLYVNNTVIDVSKPRGETISDDLQKRDFTINNLAMDKNGNIIGDTTDIDKRLIKHVYEEVFQDDPIRILRAFRFASQLGFQIDIETLNKIYHEKELLKNAPNERIYDEIIKLLKRNYNFNALKMMQQSEVLFILYPEFKKIEGLPQGKYHKDCALTHTFKVVELMQFMAEKLNLSDQTKNILLLTALFHDVGKGFTGEKNNYKNFIGHEIESVKIAKKYLTKYPINKNQINTILLLIENHTKIRIYSTETARDNTLKKFIYKHYPYLEELILFTLADNLTKGKSMEPIYQTIIRIREFAKLMHWERKNLITGHDLMQLPIEDKKMFSTILNDVHEKLVIGVLNSKDEAIKYIKSQYIIQKQS
ncbi:CCA tRNA nucleotidyltransferase [Deferribacter autotrophicus]|uniref:CCA tRNA nucleotidyltransferase n=1 Tax=Deferribacter autotrophicus TaxID=500465 RepID=A0A5A8F6W9_9BACT|nr:HD domain-containing protein [Deferribacter autotrophicus]KAA0258609.1 CCA tRNA nucleotidyltransferase [Deferribacter autotrophicus]